MKLKTDKTQENSPLFTLKSLVKSDLKKVDKLIYSLIVNKIDLIPQISEHTISSGGKRLRPILTLASAKLCGYTGTSHIDLAACVEFIHTATLLHDDVVDKSDLRRGEQTANSLWGNKESILVGDYLLGKSFHLMGAAKSLDIYRILSNAAVVISEGEVLQLSASGNIDGGKNKYFEIISAKTAELFAAAAQVSAVIAKRTDEEIQAVRNFGFNLGIAFQIVDDLLDYFSNNDVMGKSVGDDFKEQKVTLPVIYAYEKATADEQNFWKRCINEGRQSENDIETAINYMKSHNIYDTVMNKAFEYADIAKQSLSIFNDSDYKTALLDIADFSVKRTS
ncbi:MAG: polyprenyl synthetase family protein [Rickettsiales bacterium]|nr:polyprenyl synthetase family protein [Pseudomonadota bacterium]MDA0966151.1 polyprenyl synthetase family protein [Pseudomonadota bacterium]MDG4543184.1 polyprenyl synthetase family protein [Rickettsiales bacterium]MDG4545382.1 polyprenyl synthetase family protein [Rickettsiales bacterium]MDG4547831.1 polyprenyl synthetase family protein [Rickettsiales bacterium]